MFILYDKDMNKLDFPSGVKPLDIFVSSLQKERTTQTVEGVHGLIDFGAEYRDREIKLELLLISADTQDYRLQRDEVYALLDDVAYVSEEYQAGKRYSIRIDESYIPERFDNNQTFATAEINCATVGLPFAESIGTTQDIEKNGIDANDERWGVGQGIITEIDSQRYTVTTPSETEFIIYNAGNLPIIPFHQYLKITFQNVIGSTEQLRLFNQSTQTYVHITEQVKNDDIIVFDGPTVTKNDQQYFRKTRRTFIELKQGWNRFVLYHCDSATIEFDFRFYYK